MTLADFRDQHQGVELLQRSLGRGRLGHAYLFAGENGELLEGVARTLAKVLNCQEPRLAPGSAAASDCCDRCDRCRRIEAGRHPDVLWVRPESKSRVILIDQIRDLLHTVSLKPAELRTKVVVLVDADRMNAQAANAFLKTLEEPPGDSVLILLAARPENLLDTIRSRCLTLRFGSDDRQLPDSVRNWLGNFAETVVQPNLGILRRYEMLTRLLGELGELRAGVEKLLRPRSPLEGHEEIEARLRERWEDELKAAVESEYRRLRTDYLTGLQWFFRDIWVLTLGVGRNLLAVPEVEEAVQGLARRLTAADAFENLRLLGRTQQLLETNLQEALVFEVAFLRLRI